MNPMQVQATYIGGPTGLFEWHGYRLLTDPTFDPPGGGRMHNERAGHGGMEEVPLRALRWPLRLSSFTAALDASFEFSTDRIGGKALLSLSREQNSGFFPGRTAVLSVRLVAAPGEADYAARLLLHIPLVPQIGNHFPCCR